MGGGNSKVNPGEKKKKSNRSIEDRLIAEIEDEKKAIKCLLLGAGESGKSTILKQMKILHLNGFTEEEEKGFIKLIRKNTLESIQALCEAISERKNFGLDNQENNQACNNILQYKVDEDIPLHIKGDIVKLWKDRGIQNVFKVSNEFHLIDSAPYFLDNIERTFQPAYKPTLQDILRSRLTTTGIIETEFTIDQMKFRMFDVGGQRGERKKWIHCFDDVTAIMFIASLSEYDQVLAEDRTRNRLAESLDLFEGIINLPWFKSADVILFLNKKDLFEEKIKRVDIGIFFSVYTGGCDYHEGLGFIQDEYLDRNHNQSKTIYCHVTDATNTENIEFVWKVARHIILEKRITSSGMRMC